MYAWMLTPCSCLSHKAITPSPDLVYCGHTGLLHRTAFLDHTGACTQLSFSVACQVLPLLRQHKVYDGLMIIVLCTAVLYFPLHVVTTEFVTDGCTT